MTTKDRTTVPESPDRQRRIAERWAGRPDSTLEEATAEVDAELVVEAEQAAELEAQNREFAESLDRLIGCSACGAPAVGRPNGLCKPCTAVDYVLEAEAAGKDIVRGHPRQRWVEAHRARRQAIR
jgi:hypothetical protein